MAQTELHNYSVQEKLNKMDIDVIQVEAELTGDATAGDVMFINTKIPNAVAVNGGTCMIHSITAVVADHPTEASSDGSNLTGSFRLVFTNDATSVGAISAAIVAENLSKAVLSGTQGFVDVAAAQDLGYYAIFSKNSVGIVAKAAAGSRDLYVYGVTQSTDDYHTAGTTGGAAIVLNVGVVKD